MSWSLEPPLDNKLLHLLVIFDVVCLDFFWFATMLRCDAGSYRIYYLCRRMSILCTRNSHPCNETSDACSPHNLFVCELLQATEQLGQDYVKHRLTVQVRRPYFPKGSCAPLAIFFFFFFCSKVIIDYIKLKILTKKFSSSSTQFFHFEDGFCIRTGRCLQNCRQRWRRFVIRCLGV